MHVPAVCFPNLGRTEKRDGREIIYPLADVLVKIAPVYVKPLTRREGMVALHVHRPIGRQPARAMRRRDGVHADDGRIGYDYALRLTFALQQTNDQSWSSTQERTE